MTRVTHRGKPRPHRPRCALSALLIPLLLVALPPEASHAKAPPAGQLTGTPSGELASVVWHRDALRLDAAWALQPTAAPIVVAVLDTGLVLDESGTSCPIPGLDHLEILPGYDFVNDDERPDDDNGHGTLMASVLAAAPPFPGVAPDVSIMPLKVLDAERKGSELDLALAIDYALAQGADVISMSLAFPEGFIPSTVLATAVARAQGAGVVLVGASGNHGGAEVAYPAAFGGVIAVGSGYLSKSYKWPWLAAHRIQRAEYSGFGTGLDVVSPGGDPTLDVDADGLPDAVPAVGPDPTSDQGWGYFLVAGTSTAAAQASGVAALLLAAGAAPEDVRTILTQGSVGLKPQKWRFDPLTGFGGIDAFTSLFRYFVGWYKTEPSYFANPVLTIVEDGEGNRRAVALVEIVDAEGQPVPKVYVYGSVRGDVRHDVVGRTDSDGVALLATLPAEGGAFFELTVTKVMKKKWSKVASVPGAFSRFEAATFRALSNFAATGAGLQPSPFVISHVADALTPYLAEHADLKPRGPDPPPASQWKPLETIPEDFETHTPVDALMARSFVAGGGLAPSAVVFERELLEVDCNLAERYVPVPSKGAGLQPSPFVLPPGYLGGVPTLDEIMVMQGAEGQSLLLNGDPTTPEDVGLLAGTPGILIVGPDGTPCLPGKHLISNVDELPAGLLTGNPVTYNGLMMELLAVEGDAEFGPYAEEWALYLSILAGGTPTLDQTLLGAAWGVSPFATGVTATLLTSTDVATGGGASP